MEDSTKLEIKKIAFLDKKIKTDFKQIFLALGKAGVMYYAGKIESAGKELVDIIKGFTIKPDASDLAYTLIRNALINASHNIVEENRNKLEIDFTEVEKLYDNDEYVTFLNAIPDILNKEYYLDAKMLRNPRTISFLEDYKTILKDWLIIFGIEKHDASHIINRFPTYFIFSLNDELRKNASKYNELISTLETTVTPAAVKELEWINYYTYLEKQVEEPVFDESFSLKQIYTPLRSYYTKRKTKEESIHSHHEEKTKIPLDLKGELNNWIHTTEVKKAIKVISGGPGSGKSSFAKIWAAELAETRDIKVLFIPLHLFSINETLDIAISEFITKSGFFTTNPLDDIHKEEKLLIIFDGLDELSKQGKVGESIAKEFVGEIERNCHQYNSDKLKLLILISGRELIIQSVSSDFRQKKQILHLLPYFINKDEYDNFSTNKKLIKTDQRNDWWIKFGQLTNRDFSQGMPEYLKTNNLEEITAQPLLNYLVALSVIRGKINFSENTNLNEIYYDLIKGVHERAYEKRQEHKSIKKLSLEYFIRVLEEIAVSAWHGGDVRTTTVGRIERHIKDNKLSMIFEIFQESAKSGITRLLTAFYFRQAGIEVSGDKTFEFTHKSFGEYLTARRLVGLVKEISRLHHKKDDLLSLDKYDERQLLQIWCKITGETPINGYLHEFIKAEVALEDIELVKKWQETLCDLFSYNIHYGLPFGLERKEIREEQRLSRNSEEALMVLLNTCAINTKVVSEIRWKDGYSFSAFLARVKEGSIGLETLTFKCLSFIDIKNITILNLEELYGVNLSYSRLNNLNLILAVLQRANLQAASLIGAELREANLEAANLREANLEGASLQGANLQGAINLTIKQLSKTRTLYATTGIEENMLKELQDNYSELFKDPDIQ